MTSRVFSALHPRIARRERRFIAFTLIEALVVLLIISILLGIAAVSYTSVRRGQLDKAGYPIIGAAQADARRVAGSSGLMFPKTVDLLAGMSRFSGEATAGGEHLTYQQPASQDNNQVSVAAGSTLQSTTVAGYAVLTSMQGSFADSNASDGHCVMALDSTKDGTTYVQMNDAIRGGVSYCGAAFVVQCQGDLPSLPGSGTVADPYVLSSTRSCAGTTDEPVNPPKCVVVAPEPATDGVNTRSARLTWAPAINPDVPFTYEVVATGPTTVTATGIPSSARSFVMDGLSAGGSYTFHVYARNGAKRYGPVDSNAVLLVPGAPAVTVVSAAPNKVNVTWTQVAGATTYTLSRTPAFATGDQTIADSSAVNGQLSYSDTDVKAGSTYRYQVTASTGPRQPRSQCAVTVTDGGWASTGADYVMDLVGPTLTVVNDPSSSGSFKLDWSDSPGAVSYVVRSTAAPTTAYVPTGSASTATLGDTVIGSTTTTVATDRSFTVTAGSTARWMTYQVGAVDTYGRVFWGNTDAGLAAPDKPVLTVAKSATTPATALNLTWPTVATATGWTLSRDGVQIATPGAGATSYADTGLRPNTTYSYTLTVSNVQTATINGTAKTVGGTAIADPKSGTTDPIASSLTVTPDNTNRYFKVAWKPVSGATGYTLEGSNDGQTWSTVAAAQTVDANGNVTATDTNGGARFVPGAVRVYRMTALGVTSYASPEAGLLAPAYPRVTATPAAVAAGATTDTVTVSGTADGATSVAVLDAAGNALPGVATTAPTAPSIVASFTGTQPGLPLGAWVKYAAIATAKKTLTIPAWPVAGYAGETVTLTSTSKDAALPAPNTATDATGNVCPTSATTVGAAWPVDPASAASAMGCAAAAQGLSYATAITPVQTIALDGSLTSTPSLTLSWKTVPAITGYDLYRSAGKAVPATAIKLKSAATGTSYVDTQVATGTWYSYQIAPANLPARVGSAVSAVRTALTAPAVPVLRLSSPDTDQHLAAWDAVSSATGYILAQKGTSAAAAVGNNLANANNKVYWYSGPTAGMKSQALPAGATISETVKNLALETRFGYSLWALNYDDVNNRYNLSSNDDEFRCTAPMAPGKPTQNMAYKKTYGNQITLTIPTRNASACLKQFVVTRTDPDNNTVKDTPSVKADGSDFTYTATPVAANVPYTIKVKAVGQGGASPEVSLQASAYSAYDIEIVNGNPDLYYTFDEAPGAAVFKNCADADCSNQTSGNATYNLRANKTAGLNRPKSPLSTSGYDPNNYAVDFDSSEHIHLTDDSYKWPGNNFTFEAWVYLTSASQVGEIVSWGGRDASNSGSLYSYGGSWFGLGGLGTSASSGARYYGYSTGVWGHALTGALLGTGETGGSRLDPNGGENAGSVLTQNSWHLLHQTVGDFSSGLAVRHWVDGKALGDCFKAGGGTKWGIEVTSDYQWCTAWHGSGWAPNFSSSPGQKGITIGGQTVTSYGNGPENRFLQGEVDNIAVYRRVLAQGTMQDHYKLGKLFFNAANDTDNACQASPACFNVDADFTDSYWFDSDYWGRRVYGYRQADTGTVVAHISSGANDLYNKDLSFKGDLQIQDADGVWQTVGTDSAPNVNGANTTATFRFPGVTMANVGKDTYRFVGHVPGMGDVYRSFSTVVG